MVVIAIVSSAAPRCAPSSATIAAMLAKPPIAVGMFYPAAGRNRGARVVNFGEDALSRWQRGGQIVKVRPSAVSTRKMVVDALCGACKAKLRHEGGLAHRGVLARRLAECSRV